MATQADYDAISAQINSGIKSVAYSDGRQVQYATIAEMERVRDRIAAELGIAGPSRRGAFVALRTSKGL